jgi:hypothetical protein
MVRTGVSPVEALRSRSQATSTKDIETVTRPRVVIKDGKVVVDRR